MKVAPISGIVPLGTISGTAAIDCARGNMFTATLGASTTITLSNLKPGYAVYIQLTQGAAYVATWAGQASGTATPSGTVTYQFIGNSAVEGSGSATLVSSSSSGSGGDEVFLTPSGSDDTAAIAAVLQAGKIAVLGPAGATYYIDGTTMPVLSAVDSGGIRCLADVQIQPTAAWVPAVGLVSTRSNSFFQLTGTAGAYTGSIAATTNQRGVSFVSGIGSTVGLSIGDFVRAMSSPNAGVTLTQSAFIFQVETVASATTLTLVKPTTLPLATNSLVTMTLPALLQSVVPVRRFFIEGGNWDTLGRNIACLVSMTDCYGAGSDGDIHFTNVSARGFTLFAIDTLYCHGYHLIDCYGNGLNNGFHRATSSHDWSIRGWTSNLLGPAYHTTGNVSCQFYAWCNSSDYFIDNARAVNVASVFHSQGGWNATYGTNSGYMLKPSIRITRDVEIGGSGIAYGAMFDGCVLQVPHAEFGFGYDLGNMHCAETYYDNGGGAIDVGVGAFAYYYHDVYGTTIGQHTLDNAGLQSGGTVNGAPYNPVGGCMIRDNVGGSIGAIRIRNSALGIASNGLGGYAWGGGVYAYDSSAGVGLGGSTQAMKLDTGGVGTNPTWGFFGVAQSASIFFGTAFVASPDWDWTIMRMESAVSPPYTNVVVAKDPGPVAFATTHIAKLDPASVAPIRQIVLAGAGDPGCVVVAMGSESSLTGIKLISLPVGGGGGCSVLISGVSVPGDILVAEGGVNHRAIVNNAATLRQKIGTVINGTGATGVGKMG